MVGAWIDIDVVSMVCVPWLLGCFDRARNLMEDVGTISFPTMSSIPVTSDDSHSRIVQESV